MNCLNCGKPMASLSNNLYLCQCGARMEQLNLFSMEYDRCRRCGRKLKGKKARHDGYGALCKKKRKKTIEERIENGNGTQTEL